MHVLTNIQPKTRGRPSADLQSFLSVKLSPVPCSLLQTLATLPSLGSHLYLLSHHALPGFLLPALQLRHSPRNKLGVIVGLTSFVFPLLGAWYSVFKYCCFIYFVQFITYFWQKTKSGSFYFILPVIKSLTCIFFCMGCGVGRSVKNAVFEDTFPWIMKIPSIAEFSHAKVNQL